MSKKRIFAEEHPEYLKYWDFDKNTLDPYKIGPMCNEKAYWKCEHGHRFERIVFNMSRGNTTCPECKKRSTMVISKPEIMKFWDKEKNTLDPEITPARSNEYAWFKCPKCGYSWRTQICGRLRMDKCPACETNNVIRKGVNDFRTVSPQLALDTSDELNPDIDLNKLGIGSKTRIHWKCHICGFEWDAPIHGRAHRYNGNNGIAACPACAKVRRKDGYDVDYPELVPLYSPNNPIPLNEVRGVKAKFLWICPKHGEYEQKLGHMIRALKNGTIGCPYCNGFKVRREDSAGAKAPELIKEWASSNESTLYEYAPNSKYLATWCCPDCGTKWKAPIYVRVQGYGKCPTCYGNKTFKERYPELEQYYAKDNDLPFEKAVISDTTPRNWICEHGHEFEDSFYKIHKRGYRCPYCESVKALQGFNDFATLEPVISKDYDEEKNGNTAGDVLITNRPVYFKCKNGHSFKRPIIQHIKSYGKCPVCANKRIEKGINDLATTNPEIATLLSPNNERKADTLLPSFKLKVAWICPTCNGEYYAPVEDMVNGLAECPYCSNQKPLAGFNTLKALYPEIAEHLSPNNDFTADEILPTRYGSIKWICPTCGGEYSASVEDMVNGLAECPYCNNQRPLAGVNTLKALYPEIAEHLSPNNDFTADEILPTRYKSVKWICPTCGGEYSASVKDMIEGVVECPYCYNQRPLAGFNTLKVLYPEIAEEMSPDNEKGPDDVLPTSAYFAEWTCPACGYTYKASVKDRVTLGNLCPACAGKKAQAGLNSLLDVYPEIQDEWAENENTLLGIFPDEILPTSNARVWWECKDCGRKYLLSVNMWVEKHIRGMTSCTYCSGLRMRETHILL